MAPYKFSGVYKWCLVFTGCFLFLLVAGWTNSTTAHEEGPLTVAVVGDTGVGERAYHPGFLGVQAAMRQAQPNVLLHLGDFVYQPEMFPDHCPQKYLQEIRMTLVRPYPVRIFVAGDNDLPPKKNKPKASGCWDGIAPMASPFDTIAPAQPQPRSLEGVVRLGHALFVVVNTFPWEDPTPWMKPLVDEAKRKGNWVIVALHNPPITTIWYKPWREQWLDTLAALGADLVLAGNEHSYERFSPKGQEDPSPKARTEYEQGKGPVVVVSGGGGAKFKPPADVQGDAEHTAPPELMKRSEVRALIHHFVHLEIDEHAIKATTHRVCPGPDAEGNPRWKARKDFWNGVPLPCDGEPAGSKVYDQFTISK